jgi:hypothetical protein
MRRLFAILLTCVSASCVSAHDSVCARTTQRLDWAFRDIHGKLADDDAERLRLLVTCVKSSAVCVAGLTPANRLDALAVEPPFSAPAPQGLAVDAAVGEFQDHRGQRLCLLARFSGGSAAAWALDAWRLGAKGVERVDTDRVSLTGEGFTVSGIAGRMKALGSKL